MNSIYELPKFELPKLSPAKKSMFWKNKTFWLIVLIIFISSLSGFLAGAVSGNYFYSRIKNSLAELNIKIPEHHQKEKVIEKQPIYLPQTTQEEKVIQTVKEVSPAVVSIIITKDVPIIEQYYVNPFKEFFGQPFEFKIPQYRQKGTEKKEVGGGTGFIVSKDGLILTNKHVVSDKEADYTVFTNDGKKYPAKVLARDPFRDLAIIKIETKKPLPKVKLGNSDRLQIGQSVIAIGNALGEFRNTVSVGVISGLNRTVTASGAGMTELLKNLIQTDAAINRGNSGGPLLNLNGEVVGVNVAMAQLAENIGFAIPINQAKRDIEQIKKKGKIVYPFLGVCWMAITPEIQKELNLPVDYGALIKKGKNCEWPVYPGSPAKTAGLEEGDIILEFNGEKITFKNDLGDIIQKYFPGDKVVLKILRNGKKKIISVQLSQRTK